MTARAFAQMLEKAGGFFRAATLLQNKQMDSWLMLLSREVKLNQDRQEIGMGKPNGQGGQR
jgi:hypothetical protein